MKIFKSIPIIFFAAIVSMSCNKFLEEPPSKTSSLVPKTVDQLETLLNNYNSFGPENASELIFGTDDYGLIKEMYDAKASIYTVPQVEYAVWDKDNLPNYDRPYWPAEWAKIFTANMIIGNLSRVSGSEAKKKQLEAEAHFIRAYSYFKLANIYCLPYTDQNKNEPGLPIKNSTSFEEAVKRATLDETWKFIADDLQKALTIEEPFTQVDGLNRSWRASKASVYAFAARYYLELNDYKNAQDYAEKALAAYNHLRNYNTEMHFSTIISQVTIFNPNPTTVTLQYPYTHDKQTDPTDMLNWGESYYFRYLNNPWWYYIPSQDLLNLYNKTYDLRYKYHMVQHYSYDRGLTKPPFDYPGYIFFFKDKILSGPSVSEMILIKAECQIRQGNWQAGLTTTNPLRDARMDVNTPAADKYLSATSKEEALKVLLEERRRELPFILRWYDVRRYNNNNDPSDDVIMTRTFYPYNANTVLGGEPTINYTLEKNSRRFACPIPNTDIISSQGVLQQNTY